MYFIEACFRSRNLITKYYTFSLHLRSIVFLHTQAKLEVSGVQVVKSFKPVIYWCLHSWCFVEFIWLVSYSRYIQLDINKFLLLRHGDLSAIWLFLALLRVDSSNITGPPKLSSFKFHLQDSGRTSSRSLFIKRLSRSYDVVGTA